MTLDTAQMLLALADYLDTAVPPERFDISSWTKGDVTPENPCGTKACALGHATVLFPDKFKLVQDQALPIWYLYARDKQDLWYHVHNDAKLAQVLEIDIGEAYHTFYPQFAGWDCTDKDVDEDGYWIETPQSVAASIRQLVHNYYPDTELTPA